MCETRTTLRVTASSFDARKSFSLINQVPRRKDWKSRLFARAAPFDRHAKREQPR
jgi:hypothetical protein